ncbi:MAG: DNA primase [Clostridiales bacterium]|nr:DNA primase [Clostridiales bacterium]
MKDANFSEFIGKLKIKNDIAEVLGSYIKLDRRGNSYWACCPFHHEKTPSFSVSPEGFYHCFGCGTSGDVIGFIKEYENVDFMQAVQILAKRAGMEVPVFDDKSAEETAEKKRKKDRLLSLMHDTARFYLSNLYSGRAEEHLNYLAKRGIATSTAKRFGLGASLDYFSLPEYLLGKGYTPEECEGSGACAKTEEGRIIDSLGGRLIFPVINNLDEVIAFGGRVMKKTDRAKYKNTKETVLFNKSKNLYNINLVKKEKRAGALSSLIMVEGYMDAISLYEAGFRNVVASMGTSLTKEQARLCKRYSDQVFISYDGDFAGQKANLRGLDILKDEGIRVRVVPMPEGLDPDEVIKSSGAEGYQKCLDNAMPLIDFRIHATKLKYDLSRTDERRDFVKEALAIVREAESATEREELLKRISEVAKVSYSALVRDLDALPEKAETPTPERIPQMEQEDRGTKAALFVLAACLFDKPYAKNCAVERIGFESEPHQAIADFIADGRDAGKIRPSGLFDLLQPDGPLSEADISRVLNLDYGDNLDGEKAEQFFNDCLKTLERRSLEQRIARAREEFEKTSSREERGEILACINEWMKKLKNVR